MATPTENLRFGRRIPRRTGDASRAVPVAFVEVPRPGPDKAISVVDLAAGTCEGSTERGADIRYQAETGSVLVSREGGTPFSVGGGLHSATVRPLRVERVLEDEAGNWTPMVSRGIMYRVWRMTAAEGSSWLRAAGFVNGQYLVLGYTSELDRRAQCAPNQWRGLGTAAGPASWSVLAPTVNPASRQVRLSGDDTARLRALGGLVTDNGLELLTEPARSEGGTLQAPGDGGQTGALRCDLYAAQPGEALTGRTRGTAPIATGVHSPVSLTYNQALSATGGSQPSGSAVVRLSGAVFVPGEGWYQITLSHGGRARMFHWGLPVTDRWYGQEKTASSDSETYTAYLHVGWHDVAFEWAPDSNSDTFSISASNTLVWATTGTTRSQVAEVSHDGILTLKQDYVGLTMGVRASYAATSMSVPFRGYLNEAGGWVSLDLNPAVGRAYGLDDGTSSPPDAPTQDWALHSSCWVLAIPSIACALTDAAGIPYSTGQRSWKSCTAHSLWTTLRFARVSNRDVIEAGSSAHFGASGAFGGAVLGQSVYSAAGKAQGVGQADDPRGVYNSAAVLAHLSVSNLADASDVRVHDLRVRGGGLSHETDPLSLAPGGPRERAETFWDVSPWDGNDAPLGGVALVEIPKAYLTGSDGGPAFTTDEIEALVRRSVAAGVTPHIVYTE